MADNLSSYNKNSGYGECTPLELECIKHLFGRIENIEVVTDRARQIQGIDYIVHFTDGRQCNIDVKTHHYDSRLFVYEFGDTRPNYEGHHWTNGQKQSDYILWITPAFNEARLYKYEEICAFRNSDKWNSYEHRDYMNCFHKNGKTLNKWLSLDFMQNKTVKFDMKPYNCIIKHSKYSI